MDDLSITNIESLKEYLEASHEEDLREQQKRVDIQKEFLRKQEAKRVFIKNMFINFLLFLPVLSLFLLWFI